MLISIFLWVQVAVTAVGCLSVCRCYLSGTTDLEHAMSSCTVALNLRSSSRMSCISLRSCSPSPRLKSVLLYVLFSFSS